MGTPRKRRGFCCDIRHSFELIKKIRLAGRGGVPSLDLQSTRICQATFPDEEESS